LVYHRNTIAACAADASFRTIVMRAQDVIEMLVLAALWGASFLFMRIAVPSLGPIPLIALRVGIGALFLVPILAMRAGLPTLRPNWKPLLIVGVLNSAVPFCLFAYAQLTLAAGFTSVLNASTPIFAAVVAFLWLGDRLTPLRMVGLCTGLAGVVLLVSGTHGLSWSNSGLAVLAALGASLSYGVAGTYTKKYLAGVPALTVATGSMVSATTLLIAPAIWFWPHSLPSAHVWISVVLLGIGCTGVAYILFFRLVARQGPAKAMSVTFLIPLFGVLWGALFLGEALTMNMLISGLVILFGTALGTGFLTFRRGLRS
jgi:drug/metabolite transporter (DMT)-like permease